MNKNKKVNDPFATNNNDPFSSGFKNEVKNDPFGSTPKKVKSNDPFGNDPFAGSDDPFI
jgi:hypothetical protein